MHRAIDLLTDTEPAVKSLNRSVANRHGRYATVLTDIGFDYQLYLNWDEFGPAPFPDFCAAAYERILRRRLVMPERVARRATGMTRERWLRIYTSEAGMNQVFERLRGRLSKPELLDGVDTLLTDYAPEFNQAFRVLFPRLQTLANGYRR